MDQPDTTRPVPTNAALTGSPALPLTVYYDHSCPLCRHEIETLKEADPANRLQLIDCSAPDFADPDVARARLTQCDLMQAIHIRDGAGNWTTGPQAFGLLYAAVGLTGIAALWSAPRLTWLTNALYRWVARNRTLLRRSGLGTAYVRYVAWRLRRRRP